MVPYGPFVRATSGDLYKRVREEYGSSDAIVLLSGSPTEDLFADEDGWNIGDPHRQLSSRIDSFAELEPGWNGEGSQPVSKMSLESAKALIPIVCIGGFRPHVYPTSEGGVQFEFEGDKAYVEVEVNGSNYTLYVDTDDEETAGASPEKIAEAFRNAS